MVIAVTGAAVGGAGAAGVALVADDGPSASSTATPTPPTVEGGSGAPPPSESSTPGSPGPADPADPADPAGPAGDGTLTFYAHPPISAKNTSPDGYVRALEARADWADGLFLYYPASLEFGARPEIDALQAAYPAGVPLTISAKNADADGIAAFLAQLTPQQATQTLWERWQEPADDFTTPAARAEFRAAVLADIALLRPAGVRVGVHEQCWTLDPANPKPWAGEQSLLELIPPEVDIVTATCVGWPPETSGAPQMARFLDFMAAHYPGVDVGFTMLSWSVPTGTGEGSPLRRERAAAVADAIAFARAAGVAELGWFDFADWHGRDSDVGSDPALQELLADASRTPVIP